MKKKILVLIVVFLSSSLYSFGDGLGNSFNKYGVNSYSIGVGYTYVNGRKTAFNISTIKVCHNYYTSVSMYVGVSVPLSKKIRFSPIVGVNEIYLHGIRNIPINGYYTKVSYGCMVNGSFNDRLSVNAIISNNKIGISMVYRLK